ncbi:TetR/AcrR family transcriptional regulator [Undibacterium squillarum]|uniref:TetR family transcriptional regulator n=1 Tax=Undibacterium squillarum TaxID=1131567 RepID=A0ABQ2XUR7_9BURK|nr:TetR/AcrR family transcriptional regulator [Undibacterium squillarum]GGX35253.1 TetR family transcriptional regulator [Undibacterium squillarum]
MKSAEKAAEKPAEKPATQRARAPKKSVLKKQELLQHALLLLAEKGFAALNLRDLASRAGMSLGLIHYYFSDKQALLTEALQLYKSGFIAQLHTALLQADDADQLITTAVQMFTAIATEPQSLHRLWYDLKAQAMFDNAFREVLHQTEQQLIDLCAAFLSKLNHLRGSTSPLSALDLYLLLDSHLQYAMLHQGEEKASGEWLAGALRERISSG